ncbi:YppG family protein [Lentibacillus salinarum]|uniref:YppG family protein n=1 Tax=Lentibacillus salinarum TaxID=446820 RepID=A0ABW3ZUT8_9BACI
MIRRPYPYPPYEGTQSPYFNPYTAYPTNTYYTTGHYPTPFEVFSKPKQPMNWQAYPQSAGESYQAPQPNNLLYQFQDENGGLDIDKMLSTAGQVANTVQQISPMVKQVGDFMKQFK